MNARDVIANELARARGGATVGPQDRVRANRILAALFRQLPDDQTDLVLSIPGDEISWLEQPHTDTLEGAGWDGPVQQPVLYETLGDPEAELAAAEGIVPLYRKRKVA